MHLHAVVQGIMRTGRARAPARLCVGSDETKAIRFASKYINMLYFLFIFEPTDRKTRLCVRLCEYNMNVYDARTVARGGARLFIISPASRRRSRSPSRVALCVGAINAAHLPPINSVHLKSLTEAGGHICGVHICNCGRASSNTV